MPLPQLQSLDSVDFLPTKKVRLCIAGMAGAGTFGHIWDVPGVSDVLVGCHMPYAKEDIDNFLGFSPDGYANEGTAMDFAMDAFYRAYQYEGAPAIGIGVCAVTASTTAHKGDHRIFVATFQEYKATLTYVKLVKGVGAERRHLDGQICNALLISSIKDATNTFITGLDLPEGCIEEFRNGRAEVLSEERLRRRPYFSSTGKRLLEFPKDEYRRRGALLPGSFNPPHFGHFGLADGYIDQVGGPVAFTLEAEPPHKNPLKPWDILKRAKMLQGRNVYITWGAPYYVDKAKHLPGIEILLGADSLETLFDAKRWGITIEEQAKIFTETCTGLTIADRRLDGVMKTLMDFPCPPNLRCHRLQCDFDISSTDIREGKRYKTAS